MNRQNAASKTCVFLLFWRVERKLSDFLPENRANLIIFASLLKE